MYGQTRLFHHFSNDNFPHGSVTCLLQDRYGFLWIGTTDGLGRYDGTKLIEYRHLPKDTTSLSNNYIQCLYEDRDGYIWVGTREGINIYDPRRDAFTHARANNESDVNEADIVLHITQDRYGTIWYGTYNGLYKKKPGEKGLKVPLAVQGNEASTFKLVVWYIFEDDTGRLLVGTSMGLLIFNDPDSSSFIAYHKKDSVFHGLTSEQVWTIDQQPDGTIWTGTNNGLFEFRDGYFHRRFKTQLEDNFIQAVWIDGDSILWVGTLDGGLHEIDLANEQVIQHKNRIGDEYSISLNRIEVIMRDRTGLLWVGTGAGLDKTAPWLNRFKVIRHQSDNPNSLSNNIVKSIHKDNRGNLWVGTYDGLNFLSSADLQEGNFNFHVFRHQTGDEFSLSANNIFSLHEDSRGQLWIATQNGLNYTTVSTVDHHQRFRHLDETDGLPNSLIHEIQQIDTGTYWVATAAQMVKMELDGSPEDNMKMEWIESKENREGGIVNSMVNTLLQDRFGYWWMGTFDGLSQHQMREGMDYFTNYQHRPRDSFALSDNAIRCLFLDSQGRTWVGTRGGLNLIIQDHPLQPARFISFGIQDGFPNDVINFMVEDNRNNLWIGTQAGLVVFNPEAALAGTNGVKKVYGKNDGLASANTIFRAVFQDKNGTIYLGTADGLHIFHPETLSVNKNGPKVVFNDLSIFNNTVSPKDTTQHFLGLPLHLAGEVHLTYREQVFSLGFSAIDFTAPPKNRYRYRMLGFNDDWLETEEPHTTYTNLPPGTYRFQVKAANSDGVWNTEPEELLIFIQPPIWQTPAAYLFYFLLIAGLLYLLIRLRVIVRTRALEQELSIQRARSEEREMLRRKNAADFHDELGHRLTKISLFLSLAEQQFPMKGAVDYLAKIRVQAEGLSSGIRDLIWTLDPQQDSLLQTLIRIRDFGDRLFEFAPVHFQMGAIQPEWEELQLAPDVRKNVLLIFKEAMHNCLKYAEASNASLIIEEGEECFTIAFSDDGCGMTNPETRAGYGLQNMKNRARKLNARLEIISETDKGTTIKLVQLRLFNEGR
ncbi:MAG: two-component regulator propeller domain-containing protein [Saprospiraceae bacterium]|nr:hypothetical protein [Lewinella sp.]